MSDNRGLSGSAWRKAGFTALCLMASATMVSACNKSSSSSKPDCSSPEVFCVGMVTDVGKVDDKSFNQSSWEGVLRAKKDLGAVTQYIETTDPKDYAKNIGKYEGAILRQRDEVKETLLQQPRAEFELECKALPEFLQGADSDLEKEFAEQLAVLRKRPLAKK